MSQRPCSRRTFLAASTAGAVALSAGSNAWSKPTGPNDRVQIGFIGVGTMGRGHLGKFLGQSDVQVVAVCDVVAERVEGAKNTVETRYADAKKSGAYRGCATHEDFRELLARDDVDAVVIATPDHWHARGCILAAQAKKDIYCEKPLTHSIAQGRQIVQAVREHGVVFQTGSQQRSEFGGRFRQAVEYVRNGRLGKIKTVRVGVGGPPVPCDLPEQEVPAGTNWNRWVGPAPFRPYHEELCPKGIHKHFPAWRRYREYGGGGLADMGAHHFDIAQWALEMDGKGPVEIQPPAGDQTSGLRFVYANGIEMFHGGPSGCTFEGELGTLYVDRGEIKSTPVKILAEPLTDRDQRLPPSSDHVRNWLDCVRSRQDPVCTAEIGASSATVCHLANIGYALRRNLRWDPLQEHFVGDDEANQWLVEPERMF